MDSKERLLSAIHRQPVDHIPLLLRFWQMDAGSDNIPFEWRDQVRRVENTTAHGLDDTLLLEPPLGYVENYAPELNGVISRTMRMPAAEGEAYPLLAKVYETPDGPLQMVVRKTEDWPHGDNVHLFDDFNIPRMKEPLVKTTEDIRRLKYLLARPGAEQEGEFRRRAETLRQEARRLGVALDGGWIALGDTLMWLCGMERILYAQMEEPEFLEQLLDVLLEWEMMRLDALLQEGVDVIVHMAWYEGSDFWSPKKYRSLLKPRLMKMIEKAHEHGIPYRYIITKGWKPLRQDFIEMGIDCLTGIDPVQDKIDLRETKKEIGHKICLMGGVNSAVMFTQWDEEHIRRAVDDAVAALSPEGGFILFPVDAVFNNQPWEKVQVLLDEWREKYF
jgi:uroporphyrinogen-III decarboxylase